MTKIKRTKPAFARAATGRHTKKRVPIRTCIACREKAVKRDMVRIVRTADGAVTVDGTGKIRGRGANLCSRLECFEKAAKNKRFKSALNLMRALSEEELAQMRKDFEQVLHEREFRAGKKIVTLRVQKEDIHNLIEEK